MTIRQRVLAFLYPFTKNVFRYSRNATILKDQSEVSVESSFYRLSSFLISGEPFNFEVLKGKVVMVVNTASDCGYTAQYGELENLQREFKENLVILGFPANDFKEQERGTDQEIETFCKKNYSITFPLMKKSSVRKGTAQHPVFVWLSDPNLNGWNSRKPDWNFSKYLINRKGQLVNYFGPVVSPLSKEIKSAILGNRLNF